eukprot:CAMPEP_0196586900 /NCGR_PEP_ID=MMETSP1081-20130531/55871_1 /TAXON_ID=36882 /ORGANISM="Pyramimonas amylifera, Strain CCMP720" /LENGTH=457 /DNA_ID=CAMNT_0041908921 /DNA_START=297 /DNA_END=1670 /DNA_ORIENTATION=-
MASSSSSWESLSQLAAGTPTAVRLEEQKRLRAEGAGLPHTDCSVRLFGGKEEDIRVTLYRDHAAWCPYCQKVWMMFEEKQIPYKIEKINMRSYGDKPDWFLKKVPSGLLPVIEIDGQIVTESLVVMQILEREFPSTRQMCPEPGTQDFDRANELLRLERQLFGDWCGLIFRPPGGGALSFLGGGGASNTNRVVFEKTLDKVDAELGKTEGPWFLPYISMVDLQYLSHVERMCASCLYWKGLNLRNTSRWANLEAWLDAAEQLPSYQATKSDYFTHVRNIPPQYGPGYADDTPEAVEAEAYVSGKGDAWKLPLSLSSTQMEPVSAHMDDGAESARHEAAWKLIGNHTAVTKFSCRGAGKKGAKQFQAPLADPYAVPNEDLIPTMDELLKAVVQSLLEKPDKVQTVLKGCASSLDKKYVPDALICLSYLRDRIGVPRDMSYPAAMYCRAHINECIDLLK